MVKNLGSPLSLFLSVNDWFIAPFTNCWLQGRACASTDACAARAVRAAAGASALPKSGAEAPAASSPTTSLGLMVDLVGLRELGFSSASTWRIVQYSSVQ